LTASGLEVLWERHPDLPEIGDRLKAAREREAGAARAEQEQRQQAERERERLAGVRHSERARLMREIAQSYQISLDSLTGDQCAAMWMEIIEQEMKL